MPRSWVAQTLVESVLIVFGVVLGLSATSWYEHRRAVADSEAAFARVVAEVAANRESLNGVRAYHRELADALVRRAGVDDGIGASMSDMVDTLGRPLDAPLDDGETLITAFVDIAHQGVGDLFLQDVAWSTAQARNDLALVDFEDVQEIARVYRLADDGVTSTWRAIAGQLQAASALDPAGYDVATRRMAFGYVELVAQENYLATEYDRVLARFDER